MNHDDAILRARQAFADVDRVGEEWERRPYDPGRIEEFQRAITELDDALAVCQEHGLAATV